MSENNKILDNNIDKKSENKTVFKKITSEIVPLTTKEKLETFKKKYKNSTTTESISIGNEEKEERGMNNDNNNKKSLNNKDLSIKKVEVDNIQQDRHNKRSSSNNSGKSEGQVIRRGISNRGRSHYYRERAPKSNNYKKQINIETLVDDNNRVDIKLFDENENKISEKVKKEKKKEENLFSYIKKDNFTVVSSKSKRHESVIGRLLVNGQLRTTGGFYCPKDKQMFELKFEFTSNEKELYSHGSSQNLTTSIYVSTNSVIRYVKDKISYIREDYYDGISDKAIFSNLKEIVIFGDKYGFRTTSYFSNKEEVFLYIDQRQVITVHSPLEVKVYEFVIDGKDIGLKREIALTEENSMYTVHIGINDKIDMSDDKNSFKTPFYITYKEKESLTIGDSLIEHPVNMLIDKEIQFNFSTPKVCLMRLNSRFDNDL